jgi:hypothetical protein
MIGWIVHVKNRGYLNTQGLFVDEMRHAVVLGHDDAVEVAKWNEGEVLEIEVKSVESASRGTYYEWHSNVK